MITYNEQEDKWYHAQGTPDHPIIIEELNEFEEVFLANLWHEEHPNLCNLEFVLDQDRSAAIGDFIVLFTIPHSYNIVESEKLNAVERVHQRIASLAPRGKQEMTKECDAAVDAYLTCIQEVYHPATFFSDQEVEEALKHVPPHKRH